VASLEIPFHRIAIIGLGLVGGSWGLALKKRGFESLRVGYDRPEILERALRVGAIDQGEENPRLAARGADLIILATPVGEILRLLPAFSSIALPHALITDVGSTKRSILEAARKDFGHAPLFLGGHPLAGKERSGIENAQADLFENAIYAVVPNSADDLEDSRAKAFCALVRRLGGRVLVMNATEHDESAAYVSHLPQLLSTALASLAGEKSGLSLELAASGFRDVTRLAESPYLLWRDICATNTENIQQALDALIGKLQTLRDHLLDETLEREFSQALRLRKKLREKI
jgi:prephenate dehydrogenase